MVKLDKYSRRMNTAGMKKSLKTIPAIVKAFGGKESLAQLVVGSRGGKTETTSIVCNWIADNYIPQGWHYRLHLAAQHRGYTIDPRALGVDPTGFGVFPAKQRRAA